MKQHNGVVWSAKILNVISAGFMFLAGLLLLVIPNLGNVLAQRILLGVLFGLTGGAKIFGYYSNDLYRLAFQYDFAVGIFCEVMTLLVVFTPLRTFNTLPLLISTFVVLDALLKLQMSFDARRFGMKSWVALFVTALLVCGVGGFAIGAVLAELMSYVAIVGIALMVDGLENAWVTAHTVRIRAKKKNFSHRFGLDEEEGE